MWRADYYIIAPAAYYVAALYILAGLLLVWYARLTMTEVTQVPIEVQIRKRKLREVCEVTV